MSKKTLHLFGTLTLVGAILAIGLYYAPRLIHHIEFTKGLIWSFLIFTLLYLFIAIRKHFKPRDTSPRSVQPVYNLTFTTLVCIALLSIIGLVRDNGLIQKSNAYQNALIQNELLDFQKNQSLSTTKKELFALSLIHI